MILANSDASVSNRRMAITAEVSRIISAALSRLEKVSMIARPKRFLQARCAVPADFEQSIGKLGSTLVLHPFEPFADRFRDRFRHALSGNPGELLGELVGFFVLNVQAHIFSSLVDSLPSKSTILP